MTIYAGEEELPPFESYSMQNRTYRYYTGTPLYPFGYGLSYTKFSYADFHCVAKAATGTSFKVAVTVRNTGGYDGDEVVQLYVQHPQDGRTVRPLCALKGFRRIHLKRGASAKVEFTLTPEELALTDAQGNWTERAGQVTLFVGGGQPRYAEGVTATLQLKGEPYQIN